MTLRSGETSEHRGRGGGASPCAPIRPARLFALAVALTACAPVGEAPPTRPAPGSAGPTAKATCPDTPGQRVLQLVNQRRADAGLRPLHVDLRLVKAARRHAEDVADGGPFGHVGSDGSLPADRVHRQCYVFFVVGENVAAGIPSAEAVVRDWMRSPEHRDNILGGFVDTGTAYMRARFSRYGTYRVQVFGSLLHPDPTERGERVACNP